MIYKHLEKNKHIILENEPHEIGSVKEFFKFFEGYNKTASTILMHHLGLPGWSTLIFHDHVHESVKKSLEKFSKKGHTFFVRTDTYINKVDNLNFRNCSTVDLVSNINKAKKHKDRWVLVLVQPKVLGQAYLNDANFRMGKINGILTVEWTGPGFSEYHLGKDKFPHFSALHAVQQISDDGQVEKIFQTDKETLENDLKTLLEAYGLESLQLRNQFLDKNIFKKLTGYKFKDKEPTNDELLHAYERWLEKEAQQRGISLARTKRKILGLGKAHLKMHNKNPKFQHYEKRKKLWYPHHKQLKKVLKYYIRFEEKMHSLGLDVDEKILTGSFNKHANKQGIIFWDVFNLIEGNQ